MAMLLSSAQIFAAAIPKREVEVPEWGGSVMVRALSARSRTLIMDAWAERAAEIAAYDADQALPEGEREGVAKVLPYDDSILGLIFSIVDENDRQIFTLADYDKFLDLAYPTIFRLFRVMKAFETEVPEPSEALKKSSGTTRRGGSSSGSRNRSAGR